MFAAGSTGLYRDFFLVTSGELQGEAAAFIVYCMSDPEAAQFMEGKGYFVP